MQKFTFSLAFLAGIMQPPVFHKDYPEYLNYASLGQVFGHEMTHGFDDKGERSLKNN